MSSAARPLGPAGLWCFHWEALDAGHCRELAAELEEQGWGSIWYPETLGRDAVSTAWLLLGATTEITVASGVATIWPRNPMGAAAAHRALTEAFGERFLFGLGVSHAPMVEFVHHADYARPYSAMVAYLAAMDEVSYLAPAPAVEPRRLLAALGDRMLALAADRASGAHTYLVTPEHTAHAREVMGEGPLLVPELRAFLGGRDEARAAFAESWSLYSGLPNYRSNLLRLGFGEADLEGGGSDRLFDALVAHGGVDDLVAGVRRHLDAGADHVAVQIMNGSPGAPPVEEWRELAPALTTA